MNRRPSLQRSNFRVPARVPLLGCRQFVTLTVMIFTPLLMFNLLWRRVTFNPFWRRPLVLLLRRGILFVLIIQVTCLAAVSLADSVCVTASKANLRKGPGTQFPVTWEVGQFMPFDRVSRKGGWAEVKDLDGESHWISSSVISSKINCVVVRTKVGSLRQAANSRAPASELAFADRYTPFKKLDRDEAWIQVQDEYGSKYWINEANVWIPMTRSRVDF